MFATNAKWWLTPVNKSIMQYRSSDIAVKPLTNQINTVAQLRLNILKLDCKKVQKRKTKITNWLLMRHEHWPFFQYISAHLIKWPVTGLLWTPPAQETAGTYTNIQFEAGAGINQAHVYTEDKIKQISDPLLATTLRKCAPNNRNPLFWGPTSLLVLVMQLLHLSSAKVCRQGLMGGPLEEHGGGEGVTSGSVTRILVSSCTKTKAARKAACWFPGWRFMVLICSFSACHASLLAPPRELSHAARPWSTLATAPTG